MSEQPRRLVILAQYDAEGGVPPHVRIHLERLRPFAQRLVLVSNSPISPKARCWAEAVCDRVLERENIGYDFAARPIPKYRQALLTSPIRSACCIIRSLHWTSRRSLVINTSSDPSREVTGDVPSFRLYLQSNASCSRHFVLHKWPAYCSLPPSQL